MKFLKQRTKETPDKELVSLVIKGDQRAFTKLVDRHFQPVFRLSYSVLRDAARAEDVTQEVFMTLWENAEKWKPTGQLKSWLFRIARNKSIDEMRRIKPHSDIEKTSVQDGQKSPYTQTLDHQLTSIINDHMQNLPDRQREAIMLVHFLDCTNIEAAQTMEISVDALESLLARGRKKLKEFLGEHKNILFKGGE